jgi:hypothetical protein
MAGDTPAQRPGGWLAALRALARMTLLDFLGELGLKRWLLVPPGFAALTLVLERHATYDYHRQVTRTVTAWDLPVVFMVDRAAVLWGFALGFVLIASDGLTRAREHGTATQALVRAPSRALWWAARLGTVGLQALTFTAIAMLVIWLMGARNFPVTSEHSPAALGLDGGREELYPLWRSVPMPVFVLAVSLYAAVALWLFGCFLMTVSLVLRQPFVPYLVGVGWVFTSMGLYVDVFEGKAWTWNLANLISYSKHLRVGDIGMPLGSFLAGGLVLLAAIFTLGAFWLQERDLS